MPVELRQNSRHRPNKDACIPAKIPFVNKRFCQVDIRFFPEAHHARKTGFARNGLAHFNVTEPWMGRCWSNANRDQRAFSLRGFDRISENFLKRGGLLDHVIGWQNNHGGGVIARCYPSDTECDGSGSIAF